MKFFSVEDVFNGWSDLQTCPDWGLFVIGSAEVKIFHQHTRKEFFCFIFGRSTLVDLSPFRRDIPSQSHVSVTSFTNVNMIILISSNENGLRHTLESRLKNQKILKLVHTYVQLPSAKHTDLISCLWISLPPPDNWGNTKIQKHGQETWHQLESCLLFSCLEDVSSLFFSKENKRGQETKGKDMLKIAAPKSFPLFHNNHTIFAINRGKQLQHFVRRLLISLSRRT